MNTGPHTIFRDHAVAHYTQRQEETVVPRLVSLPLLISLWVLLGLLLVCMLLLVFALFPLLWR